MKKLENRTAIITGAGSGIGQAIAELFFKEGATVVLLDKELSTIQQMSERYIASGEHALAIACDVSKELDVIDAVSSAKRHFGGVDILVNNAGVMDDFIPAVELDTSRWNHVISTNLNGPFYSTREVLKIMLPEKRGAILNISSIGGLSGGKAGAAYTASKHGLIGLTKNTAIMHTTEGIRCNAIAPGGVETSIGLTLKPNQTGYTKIAPGFNLMPRTGKPDEIAQLALFLVSDDASFINGAIVTADAGWSAF
jgi:NAD(P)-dependent dehydrogenase (short-subunit alcohol dehydrogenase family)